MSRKTEFKPLASRTLYKYINLVDQAILASDDPKLDTATIQALESESIDEHFEYFKSQLDDGKLSLRERISAGLERWTKSKPR
jgi:hypothetical protein